LYALVTTSCKNLLAPISFNTLNVNGFTLILILSSCNSGLHNKPSSAKRKTYIFHRLLETINFPRAPNFKLDKKQGFKFQTVLYFKRIKVFTYIENIYRVQGLSGRVYGHVIKKYLEIRCFKQLITSVDVRMKRTNSNL
jgi:hypothetical protein